MFSLSQKQRLALDEQAWIEFSVKACAYLRSKLPRKLELWSDARIDHYLRNVKGRAQKFGLVSERAVVAFAHLSLLVDPSSIAKDAKHASLRQLLDDCRYDQHARVEIALKATELRLEGEAMNKEGSS